MAWMMTFPQHMRSSWYGNKLLWTMQLTKTRGFTIVMTVQGKNSAMRKMLRSEWIWGHIKGIFCNEFRLNNIDNCIVWCDWNILGISDIYNTYFDSLFQTIFSQVLHLVKKLKFILVMYMACPFQEELYFLFTSSKVC